MREAFDTLIKKYPNVDFLEKDLTIAFEKYKQYFPKKEALTIVTYFSGFNFGVVTNDTIVAIGLDYFLGKDCGFYKRLNSPEYMRNKNQKKFILPQNFVLTGGKLMGYWSGFFLRTILSVEIKINFSTSVFILSLRESQT